MKRIIKYLIILIIVGISIVLSINFYVILSTKKQIVDLSYLKNKNDYDCIIVLGAGIWGDKPSPMLQDRLDEAIKLYEEGIAPKLIMSGDNGREGYDEVNVMKDYAINKGIPSEDIFMDHAGFSTYESIYRAKEVFKVEKAIIVTQKYHLYRALHIGNKLGINVTGVGADPRKYSGQIFRELREILARNKDFIQAIFKLKPTYLGESIPVSGDGNITNDKEKEAE
ncbi:MAG: SanA protein [Firmicutes bacterium]|nr:SanA protein [Bacillota bacterium]